MICLANSVKSNGLETFTWFCFIMLSLLSQLVCVSLKISQTGSGKKLSEGKSYIFQTFLNPKAKKRFLKIFIFENLLNGFRKKNLNFSDRSDIFFCYPIHKKLNKRVIADATTNNGRHRYEKRQTTFYFLKSQDGFFGTHFGQLGKSTTTF